ncbi:SigB/SigF/SigG family RNA polymerase sigma factor [soil metagenome]
MFADEVQVTAWFREYHASGSRAVRDRIVEHHRWIAERCARRFADRGEPAQDLMQVAQIGIVKAVERFDPERGHGFPAFAMPTVMGELRRHFRDTTWDVKVPRRSKDLVAGVNSTIASLNQTLGRPPQVDEVARAMDLTPETVLETLEAARCYRAGSLDDAGEEGLSVQERIGEEDADLDNTELRITMLDAICRLDERSQRIVLWRFYDGLTQAEIGQQLGIGQVQVSRLLRAALTKMRPYLDLGDELGDAETETESGGRSDDTSDHSVAPAGLRVD